MYPKVVTVLRRIYRDLHESPALLENSDFRVSMRNVPVYALYTYSVIIHNMLQRLLAASGKWKQMWKQWLLTLDIRAELDTHVIDKLEDCAYRTLSADYKLPAPFKQPTS